MEAPRQELASRPRPDAPRCARWRRRTACLFAGLASLGQAPDAWAADARTPDPSPLTVVTFGTSLTARGEWQETLRDRLGACLHRPVEMRIVARSGVTSEWALTHVEAVAAARPDVVLVEFAHNDAALNRWISLGRSRENMRSVLSNLNALSPRPRVVNLGMNPVHGLRGWIRPRLGLFIGEHRRIAVRSGAEFLDLRPSWTRLGSSGLRQLIPDGVHPVPAAAQDIIVPRLVDLLCPP